MNTQHNDQADGCRHWHSCLSCPFPACYHDDPGAVTSFLQDKERQAILQLAGEGKHAGQIADAIGLSRRAVYRRLSALPVRPAGVCVECGSVATSKWSRFRAPKYCGKRCTTKAAERSRDPARRHVKRVE